MARPAELLRAVSGGGGRKPVRVPARKYGSRVASLRLRDNRPGVGPTGAAVLPGPSTGAPRGRRRNNLGPGAARAHALGDGSGAVGTGRSGPKRLPAGLDRSGDRTVGQRQVIWISAASAVVGTLATPPPEMSVADKLRALAAAARGAHALHDHGQLHGAICPQSVVLLRRPGISGESFSPTTPPPPPRAVLGPPSLADGKQPAAQVGYPPLGYLDPQLLRGEGGRWSDIWALGATLHYALTGAPPFPLTESVPVVQGLAQLLAAPAPAPQVQGLLAGLVTACLSLDPLDRPPTARDVAEQLEDAAARC